MMMKYLIAILACAFLTACGGGGDGDDLWANPIVLSHNNQTLRIDRTDQYGLDIASSGNRITIAQGNFVTSLRMPGTNNTVFVEPLTYIGLLDMSGANNSVSLSNTTTVGEFRVLGTNAVINVGDGASVDRLFVQGSNAAITIEGMSANVPLITLAGSNIILRIPAGYLSKTTITNIGTNNAVTEY
jgi:hypothetical protein